jgi:putative flippase GtrA
MKPRSVRSRVAQLLRAGAAGALATLVDLGVLTLLISGIHVAPSLASVPALVAGGTTNFFGNRHFAFRGARDGSLARQVALYCGVEVVMLALNGVLFEAALRTFPWAAGSYWAVRFVTSHIVFLGWSYPMWRRVFKGKVTRPDDVRLAAT